MEGTQQGPRQGQTYRVPQVRPAAPETSREGMNSACSRSVRQIDIRRGDLASRGYVDPVA